MFSQKPQLKAVESICLKKGTQKSQKMTILKKNFESMKYIRRQSTFRKSRIFLRKIILVLPLLALNSNLMSQVFVLSYYIKTLQSSDTLRPTSCQFSRYDNVDDDETTMVKSSIKKKIFLSEQKIQFWPTKLQTREHLQVIKHQL